MSFNHKVLLLPNTRKLSSRQAEIDIDNPMALRACEMVMVFAPTAHTIVMGTIRKLDAGEQSHSHQFFDRAVDRRAANTRLILAKFLPEVLNGEICAAAFQFNQAFRDDFARACIALAYFIERRINFLC